MKKLFVILIIISILVLASCASLDRDAKRYAAEYACENAVKLEGFSTRGNGEMVVDLTQGQDVNHWYGTVIIATPDGPKAKFECKAWHIPHTNDMDASITRIELND